MIRKFNSSDKTIASVCTGALPIGKSGVLKGRRGTTYQLNNSPRQSQLKEFGVIVEKIPVVTDRNITSS